MMSVVLRPVIQLERYSVWILITDTNANAETDILENSARLMWMIVLLLLAEMGEDAETLLVILSASVQLAGRENGVRLMNSGVMNLLVRIMLFVLISSKMCSVLVPLELMAKGVKLLLRDVLEILV